MKTLVWICSVVMMLLISGLHAASAETYVHPETGTVFPDKLAGLEKGTVTDFEKEYPGFGVGIGYNAPGITATIYLYNLEMRSLPEELDSPVLTAQFEEAVDEVLQAGQAGRYENLRKTSETVVVLPSRNSDRGALCASFNLVQQGVERISNLYLTVCRNHFLKLRFTYDVSAQARAEETLDQLLAYFARAMEDGTPRGAQAPRQDTAPLPSKVYSDPS